LTRASICLIILTSLISLKAASQLNLKKNSFELRQPTGINILPQNFYNQHKGYVCKKEDLLQKATGLNLFIRLGSKNYVDYLERKPNAIKQY